MLNKHLDKNNLHHAYLIEGRKEEILSELLEILNSFDFNTENNPDFLKIELDSIKIDEALYLRDLGNQQSFTENKKIIIVLANNFNSEAQNTLLKMFEEPIHNTHFFIIIPEADSLLHTFISRFYFIKNQNDKVEPCDEAVLFLKMSKKARIDYIKEFLADTKDEDDKNPTLDSVKSKSLLFLNDLEAILCQKFSGQDLNSIKNSLEQILNAREFLRMSGSSAKMLMESVALAIPEIK